MSAPWPATGRSSFSRQRKPQKRRKVSKEMWLSPSDLKTVRSAIWQARSKWYHIGVELGVPVDTLKSIKEDNRDVVSYLTEMLVYWLNTIDPKPSWGMLIDTLQSCTIHEDCLADSLKEKYCSSVKSKRRCSLTKPVPQTQSWPKRTYMLVGSLFIIVIGMVLCYTILYSSKIQSATEKQAVNIGTSHPGNVRKFSKTLPRNNEKIVFVGRGPELKNLTALLRPSANISIISITGPPGFGKSTLAIHAGYEAEKAGYTVVYVDIAEVHDVNEVKREILTSAKREEQQSFESITDWAKSITTTSVLILDNCDSALHQQKDDFQSVLKDMWKQSQHLKIVLTTKQVTMFLGSYHEHIQIRELDTKNAAKVLRRITSNRINDTFAFKLAKCVGNVPLALQVVGTLLKDMMYNSEEIYLALRRNIIETLSPEQLPPEDRVATSLNVSYHFLPKRFQSCGQWLTAFPGPFPLDAADHVLKGIPKREMTNTQECLNILVRRSLLTTSMDSSTRKYKYHQLVKDFFEYTTKQRYQKAPLQNLPKLLFRQYYFSKHIEFMKDVKSISYHSTGKYYDTYQEDLINIRSALTDTSISQLNYTKGFESLHPVILLYNKACRPKCLNASILLSLSHGMLVIMELKYMVSQPVDRLEYFSIYVNWLINLGRLETAAYNASFALDHLEKRFRNVTELYHNARKNNSIESHRIYADYYAALATKYRQVNDFDRFMECWQQVLKLRYRCETVRCTKIQLGMASFGNGRYQQAIRYLEPELYSKKLPVNKRARLFVLVYHSYIELGVPEEAERLLNLEAMMKNYMYMYIESFNLLKAAVSESANQSASDIRSWTRETKPRIPSDQYSTHTLFELIEMQLGFDDLDFSLKNCRTLMIFGDFLKRYSHTVRDRVKVGNSLQKKVYNFIHFYEYVIFERLNRRPKPISTSRHNLIV